jgi:phage baseplate assembly protein W
MAIYSDFDAELEIQQDGDITRDLENEAIRNSLINIINTRQGSRRMLPIFAVGLMDVLFEPMDDTTAREIGNRIFGAIELWDDRVIVEVLNINQNFDKGQYEITLDFRLKTSRRIERVDFILKQG